MCEMLHMFVTLKCYKHCNNVCNEHCNEMMHYNEVCNNLCNTLLLNCVHIVRLTLIPCE